MNEYYVETMKTKKIYDDFIYHMISHSDFFSVVYYRLRKDSPLNKYLKEYKKALRPYILHAENAHISGRIWRRGINVLYIDWHSIMQI